MTLSRTNLLTPFGHSQNEVGLSVVEMIFVKAQHRHQVSSFQDEQGGLHTVTITSLTRITQDPHQAQSPKLFLYLMAEFVSLL